LCALVVAAVGPAEGPEGRPVADAVAANHREVEAGLDAHPTAGASDKVGALGLDAGGGPAAGAVAEGSDLKSTVAVELQVAGAAGVGLDLPGAPLGGTAGVASACVDDPV
jgi:hypothetical protein